MSNKSRTASFDIDCQRSFGDFSLNELYVPGGEAIVPELNFMATFAEFRLCSQDAHSPMAPWVVKTHEEMLQPTGLPDADLTWVSHCVPGTPGFELLPGLPPVKEYSFAVFKGVIPDLHPLGACWHTPSNKLSTGVIEYLKLNGVERVIAGGLALDFCVKSTALQLAAAGFEVLLYLPACRGISPEGCAAALAEMKLAGVIIVNNQQELTRLA